MQLNIGVIAFINQQVINEVIIKIYDAAGVLVDRLSKDNLVHNEFNEILWDTSKLNSGLYFAELKSDLNESKLIKMVIIK